MPDVFAGLPATDVDLAEVDMGDIAILAPRAQRLASGSDGAIAAAANVLTSAFPFQDRGIQVGHVLVIRSYQKASGSRSERPDEVLAIKAVSGASVTIGPIGYDAGQGDYPIGVGTTGIAFEVRSVRAQIVTAYQDVLRRLGLTTASPLVNPTDLRLITVKVALRGLLWSQYRQSTDDTFKSKMADLAAEITDLFSSLDTTYNALTPAGARPIVGPMTVDPRWRIPSDGRDCDPWDVRWIPGT